MYKSSFFALLLVLTLASPGLAEMMSTTFSGAELRSSATVTAKVVTELPRFSPLTVLEKGPDYHKVKDYRGRTGWVQKSLLCTTPAAIVTGDRANVRQGPGTEHAVTFQMSKGETARVLDKQEKWVQVENLDGQTGWVADFLVWGE